ncbi:hypothetical protein GNX71_08460 [Variovorax sp. RKNM96]|uniref:hypothetical protein n=1 Tax=Variovorax sp. RKNM96 TaxID=2681552 RepID=UPI00197E5580|nr:hypothetical protein [Variovorax sp. RKNM96]QSI29612.1 hypothetical protein GNX71_08460 [Variovorax sp. RKNM96]
MNQEIILESLTRALDNWIRHASAEQLWQVHQVGGLGASIHAEGDIVQARVTLGGPRNVLSDIGKTDGRLPVTEAFLGKLIAAWGTPPPQGSPEREQWFLSNELAQTHARQYLMAEVSEKRNVLARFVEDWIARNG